MDKIYEQTLLYDFYGELLTEHQQKIYEDAVYNDMSLGEIAQEQGISRQGVHDMIKRCDKILNEYEAKLHLVERFGETKSMVSRIVELTMSPKDAACCDNGYEEKKKKSADEEFTDDPIERLEQIRNIALKLKNAL